MAPVNRQILETVGSSPSLVEMPSEFAAATTASLVQTASPFYVRVAPYLYRHVGNGSYHARKKVKGKHKERSLGTTDRKIAERRMKEWIESLGKVDAAMEKATLRELIERYRKANSSLARNTQVTNEAIIKCFLAWWRGGLDAQVRHIRVSQLDEWLALQEPRLRNVSYNRYTGFLKQLFDIAVNDRIIAESPAKHLRAPWKKVQTPVRRIPTIQQFEQIIAEVRRQLLTDHGEDSADFLEFLGLAGLGQAEASALTWGDVDWELNRLNVRRCKTDTRFWVPIYPHLRPLLEKLHRNADRVPSSTRVFKIKDAKKALAGACDRLGFVAGFSQRNLRQCLIGRLWRAGVDRKLIARWQGHRDGGELILSTYTETFGDDDDDYERRQLEKLAA